jgi:hypothetical protein
MRPIEQINEKRISRSIQAYMEGEPNCTLNWILGVISSDVQIADRLLSTQLTRYANTPKYHELQNRLRNCTA